MEARFRDVLRSPIAQRLAHNGAGDYYGSTRDADTRYNLGFRHCVHLLTQRDPTQVDFEKYGDRRADTGSLGKPTTRQSSFF